MSKLRAHKRGQLHQRGDLVLGSARQSLGPLPLTIAPNHSQPECGRRVGVPRIRGLEADGLGIKCQSINHQLIDPNCTMWADGYNGIHHHVTSRAAFVVSSPDLPEVQRRFAASRGWKFPMVSHAGTSFAADMGFRGAKGSTLPSPGDDFCTVWHMFDLLPGGAGDWWPKFQY
jgi:hypothetical protein